MSEESDLWVIGTWHVFSDVRLLCVPEKDGSPSLASWPTSELWRWYTWNSYHAARKFQREHARLDGYVICNLSKMKRQCQAQKERDQKCSSA